MSGATSALAPRRRRGARVIVLVLGLVLIVLVGLATWVCVRAILIKSEVDSLTPLAQEVKSSFEAGDLGRVDELIPDFAEHAATAASLSGDPVWAAAEAVPVVGANLRAVRIVASQLDAISARLPALTGLVRDLSASDDNGQLLPLAGLRDASGSIDELNRAMQDAAERLDGVDTSALISPISRGVEEVREFVDVAAPALDAASRATEVLPAILGLDRERTILVMLQNPAELRTGGGITGTFAEVKANDGRLSLVGQAQSREFAPHTSSIVDLPADVTTVYSDVVGRFVQNASAPADFALTAEIATAWWQERTGTTPDTIVSVDPYVLGALLSATGPVDLPNGTQLTADNLEDTLLVQPYLTLSSDEQTELYQAAVDAVFSRLSSGGIDVMKLATALQTPIEQGRISVWNADPTENDVIGASLAGPRARQDAAGDGAFAVYFNDATGAKMARFLDIDIDAAVSGCTEQGLAEVVVTVDMASTAPADVETWPISVTGGGLFGVGAGDIGTNVSVEGPRGSFAGEVIVKGETYPAATAMSDGRATSAARVNLSPGEENRLEFHFFLPQEQARQLAIVHTPLMGPSSVTVSEGACA